MAAVQLADEVAVIELDVRRLPLSALLNKINLNKILDNQTPISVSINLGNKQLETTYYQSPKAALGNI